MITSSLAWPDKMASIRTGLYRRCTTRNKGRIHGRSVRFAGIGRQDVIHRQAQFFRQHNHLGQVFPAPAVTSFTIDVDSTV
jgi:hypothetical protein